MYNTINNLIDLKNINVTVQNQYSIEYRNNMRAQYVQQ